MSDTFPNWSNLLKTKRAIVNNDWPHVAATSTKLKSTTSPQQVDNSDGSRCPTSNISESLQKLVLTTHDNGDYNKLTDNRSRDEILAERRVRKTQIRQQKAIDSYHKKLAEIREPKTDKLKVIASADKQKFDRQKESADSNAVKRLTLPVAKRSTTIEVNLLDLVAKKPVQQKKMRRDRYRKLRRTQPLTVIKRHKGKKREIPKKKWLSRLKKSVLRARQLRRERCAGEQPEQQSVFEIAETQPIEEQPASVVIRKEEQMPSCSPATLCCDIQFSRKFRS